MTSPPVLAREARPWDAVVIGGGPAGSSVAAYLAREGRRVLLLDRARFPRPHIGESLLPGVLPYLDALGARDLIEGAGFERKEGQTFIWGRDRTPWEIDFRELDVHPYAYFVDRGRFDHLLLQHARRSGADVREGRAVTRILFEGGRAAGVVHRGADGGERVERARFVVDASGQSALTARGADLLRPVRGLKNVALWSYWKGAARMPGHRRAHILTTSVPEGWVWVIPLGDERTSVGVVTSSSTRAERDRLGAEAWYEGVLRRADPVWGLLGAAERVDPVTGARDWSYRARRLSGPGILLAGDAACFIDPILSTGVHLAMTSGYWAAACVHSALAEPRHEPFLRRFYDETYGATYRELLAQVKAFYRAEGRRDSVYWTSKRILRAGSVRADLAFLFITAGLLRNAAMDAPHDAAAEIRASLGARSGLSDAPAPAPEPPEGRAVSRPLVWRVGPEGAADLVTVRADGMRLRLERHEPCGLRDRPRDAWFCLELHDAERSPIGLVLVEERRRASGGPARGGRLDATLLPYPVRPHDPAVLAEIRCALGRALGESDDPAAKLRLRAVRARLRGALGAPGALPEGVAVTRSREHRGGGVDEPPLTVVFEATAPLPVRRLYVVIEARIPPELTEIPILRTRFLDVWARPARAADGTGIMRAPGVAAFFEAAAQRLWGALRGAGTRAAAFAAADEALAPPGFEPAGLRRIAGGRLGEAAPRGEKTTK